MIKAIIFDIGNTLVNQDTGLAFPHAIEVLERLREKYRLAAITNTMSELTEDDVRGLLKVAGIPIVFDIILVSSEMGMSKPDPRIFEAVLESLDVEPEEAVMIGNTVSTDIFGGNRVGMKTVLIQFDEEYNRSEWETPDHTIHSLKDLIEII